MARSKTDGLINRINGVQLFCRAWTHLAIVWLALEIASVMKKLLIGELRAVLVTTGAAAVTALMYSPFIQTAP